MKTTFAGLLLPLVFFVAGTRACAQERKMIKEINAHSSGMALWWAGHNSWIVKSGEIVVSTDLWLEDGTRFAPAPISAEELAPELDISFVTHGHDDHFNKKTSMVLLQKSKCIFVLPESCVAKAKEIGIPEERMRVAKPRESFDIIGVKVSPVRAIHGNANFAVYYEANLQDCGYFFVVDGISFLQPGDSYLLEDHLFLKHVDVLFFSPTEHNMYIDRSVILINTLNPAFIFPQHHSTIKFDERNRFWAKGYPAEVRIHLAKEMQDKYHILEPGDKRIIKP